MRYYDPNKMELKADGIYYIDRKISLVNFKYAYISGYYSPTEFSDNLGCYSVKLRVGNNSYTLCDTRDKSTAKYVLNYVQKQVGAQKGVKKYNNALISMEHVHNVKLEKEIGYKVKVHIKNGRILRVFKSPFKLVAQIEYNKINYDFQKYKESNPIK